jgi:hypothetical protein
MEKQTSFIKKTIALLIAQVLVLLVLLNVVVWVVLRGQRVLPEPWLPIT